MYIAAMKARFSKLDQENFAMKIQVWEKQYPSDKTLFEDTEMLPKKIIKNKTKLTQRTKEAFQMTFR